MGGTASTRSQHSTAASRLNWSFFSWWCKNLGNAVLEREKKWALDQNASVASYDFDLYLLGGQGRQIRFLGRLLADIYGWQDDDKEVVFERHTINTQRTISHESIKVDYRRDHRNLDRSYR